MHLGRAFSRSPRIGNLLIYSAGDSSQGPRRSTSPKQRSLREFGRARALRVRPLGMPGSWLLLSQEGCDAKAHCEEVLGHEPMLSSSESQTFNLAVHASLEFLSVCILTPKPL